MRSLPRAIRQTRCFSYVYREISSNELGRGPIRRKWNFNLSGYFVEEYLHANTKIAGKGRGKGKGRGIGNSQPSLRFVFTRPFSSTVSTTDSDIIATSPEKKEKKEEKEEKEEKAGPLVEYQRRIASGDLIEGDHFQVDTIQLLQRLYDDLIQKEDECQLDRYTSSKKAGRSRWLWSRLIPQSTYAPVKGLYLYGGVGTGKTMLMDLFYEQLPSDWRKKRTHFHDFMLHVHSHLQMHKGVADPLEVVAAEISDEAIILCLDEFMVSDVADALILNRLFRHLFSKGVVLVSTSNRAPDNLYEGGLQRDLFLPFIENLKERCIVHEIGSSVDYRKMGSAEQGYNFVGSKYNQLLKQKFQELVGDEEPRPHAVHVIMGRKLEVPLGANGCAYFQFEDLCDKPLGVADYWALFEKFHTLALEGVPKFGISNRTAAYRFVALVDVLYEKRGRLLCTAEAPPVELFESIVTVSDAMKMSPRSSSRSQKNDDLDLCVDNELGFAKDRTISRLTELNSREYLEEFEGNLKQQCRAVEA